MVQNAALLHKYGHLRPFLSTKKRVFWCKMCKKQAFLQFFEAKNASF